MVKISHHFSSKFTSMYLDWIPREKNQMADKFSRYGSKPRFTSDPNELFRIFFNVNDVF